MWAVGNGDYVGLSVWPVASDKSLVCTVMNADQLPAARLDVLWGTNSSREKNQVKRDFVTSATLLQFWWGTKYLAFAIATSICVNNVNLDNLITTPKCPWSGTLKNCGLCQWSEITIQVTVNGQSDKFMFDFLVFTWTNESRCIRGVRWAGQSIATQS